MEDANLRNVVMRSYYDMNRTVSEQGVKRAEGMTPREFEARLIQTGLPHRDVERLTRLRIRQNEYSKLEARLHKEKQFNRKVALNAQLRELKTAIDQLATH